MKRPRLKPDEVRCVECGQALLKSAAVIMNDEAFHPIKCFGRGLKARRATIDALIVAFARGGS